LFFSNALPAFGAAPRFTDVTRAAGIDFVNISGGTDKQYLIETQSAGGGFWDCDLDGCLDLFLTSGARPDSTASTALYRNVGAGAFTDVTAHSGTGLDGWNMGVAFADYDSDGDPDLYLTRWGRDALLANRGDGTFTDVTAAAALGSQGWGVGAAFADYDSDGDLDLYVANYIAFELGGPPFYDSWCTHNGIPSACGPSGAQAQPDVLYRNEGDGTFSDVSGPLGLRGRSYYGMGVAWSDLDADGDLDLYVANDGHPNSLWRNDGNRFVDTALATGTAYSGDGRPQASMGVALADYDNDLQVDIFVTNFAQDYNTLYRNEGHGFFADVSGRTGLSGSSRPFMGWGTFFFDCDHDGWQDLFVANGHLMPAIAGAGSGLSYRQRNQLYRNLGDGRFQEVAPEGGLAAEEISRGAATGDYDHDGDLDILVANLDAPPTLLRNDTEHQGHWLLLALRQGATEAIGARVQITADGRHQLREVQTSSSFQAQSDTRLHFGLGLATTADIEVTWPDGERQVFSAVAADRHYLLRRGADRPITE
jgi:hypothetical protein